MTFNPTWNRRTFLTSLGLTTAATALPATALPAASPPALPEPPERPTFAFVAQEPPGITAFHVHGGRWTRIGSSLPSTSPAPLAAHPTLPILYTATAAVSGRRGQASAIAIDPALSIATPTPPTHLQTPVTLLNTQPLALATTNPHSLSVSPDGTRLLITDLLGSLYNVLPIAPDGSLRPVEHVLKQTGDAYTNTAGPYATLFHPSGDFAYTTETFTGCLCRLSFAGREPLTTYRFAFSPFRPANLALHPAGHLLLVTDRLRPALSVYPLNPVTGHFSFPVDLLTLAHSGLTGPLALHPAGNRVYVATHHHAGNEPGLPRDATALHTLRLSRSGHLSLLARTPVPGMSLPRQIHLHGKDLLLLGSGGVTTLPLNPRTGVPGPPALAVEASACSAMILRSA